MSNSSSPMEIETSTLYPLCETPQPPEAPPPPLSLGLIEASCNHISIYRIYLSIHLSIYVLGALNLYIVGVYLSNVQPFLADGR